MRLLLLSLCSLFLLYASVSCHPRGRGSKDCSRGSSEHNSRGSGRGSKDVEDWLKQFGEQCGLRTEMMEKLEKVAPAEIRSVVSSSAAMLEKVAHGFTKHSMDIADLEANMDGQTPEQLVESHINLLYQFQDLVVSAIKEGMCDFVSMQMLLDRITYLGSEDFGDSRCNEANRMVSTLDGISPEMNARQQITLMWLYRFGAAIRNDMNCIVNDIEALRQHVNSLKKLTETDGASLREVHIGLSTTMAYEGMLEHELDQFRRAVEMVGEALEYIDIQKMADANIKRRYRSVAESLKRLLSNI